MNAMKTTKSTSGRGGLARALAWRRLADRPLRSTMTAAGVAAGVAFLFSVLSLSAQIAADVRESAVLLAGPRLLQIAPASPAGLPDGLAEQLSHDDRVAAAAPLILARTRVSSGPRTAGVFVLGLTPDAAALAPDAIEKTTIVQSGPFANDGGLVLSRGLARRLDAEVDGQVALHASTITAQRVLAVASSPLIDRVNGGMAAAMPLAEAQRMFGRTGRVDQILVRAKPGADLAALRRDVAAATGGIGVVSSPGAGGGGNIDFQTIQLGVQFVGYFVLFAAVLLVFDTMSMATAERRIEIALARSLGASRRQLLLVTLTEAGVLGVAGTAVGLVAGGALAQLVVPIARSPYRLVSPVDMPTHVSIHLGPAMIAATAGIVGAVLGAVIPARRAARAAPIDAFRPTATYEWRDPTRPARQLTTAMVGAAMMAGGLVFALRHNAAPSNRQLMVSVMAVYVGALLLVPTAIPYAVRAAAALLDRVSTTTGRLAGDALRANPRRTTFTVVALLLPLAAAVIANLPFTAARAKSRVLARAFIGAPLNVDADSLLGGCCGTVAFQPLAAKHQSVFEGVPGVGAVLPYENANIGLPDHSQGAIYAIPLTAAERAGVSDMVKVPRLADDPAAFTQSLGAGQIAASHFAGRTLHLRVGSRLSLPTPSGPRVFTVGALFDDWAFKGTFAIDLDTYRAIWGDDSAFRYAIVPTAGTSVDELRSRVETAVTAGGMPALVRTRGEAMAEFVASNVILADLVQGMALACFTFAALALANAAFTAVTERRWSFGLQRTLGMTTRQVVRSLVLEAVAIGVVGAIGGVVVGLGLGVVSSSVVATRVATTVPHPVPWALLAASIVVGVAIAASATSYPRRTAKRLTIIEALRFE